MAQLFPHHARRREIIGNQHDFPRLRAVEGVNLAILLQRLTGQGLGLFLRLHNPHMQRWRIQLAQDAPHDGINLWDRVIPAGDRWAVSRLRQPVILA